MAGQQRPDGSWQLALALIAAWRGAGGQRGRAAIAWRLAEAMAGESGAAMADQVVLDLIAAGDMFLELYADCAGAPVDSVLRDAAALARDGQPLPPAQSRAAGSDPVRETTDVSALSGVEAS